MKVFFKVLSFVLFVCLFFLFLGLYFILIFFSLWWVYSFSYVRGFPTGFLHGYEF